MRHSSLLLLGLCTNTGCVGVLTDGGPERESTSVEDAPDRGTSATGAIPGVRPADLSCDVPSVGHRPLPRLSRAQYQASVLDLTGIDIDADALLPEDEYVGTFFQNRITPVSSHDLELYRSAAEWVAGEIEQTTEQRAPCVGDDLSACAANFIDSFGRSTHRRPLNEDERSTYQALYESEAAQGYARGISLVVEAMLQSPFFLYRLELTPEPPSDTIVNLNSFEIASRLSFLLWNSSPDATLLDLSEAGSLTDPTILEEQATRLFSDKRADRTIATFHSEWLDMWRLPDLEKDEALFPNYSANTVIAMAGEAAQFVSDIIVRGDGRVETLFTQPFSADSDATARAGVLMLPAFLASTAQHDQTSTVLRGATVRTHVLCDPPPPPPPDAEITPPEQMEGATTRERFAAHTESPACANCHTLMDPIGFAFEHYDAIGNYRADESGLPIDATGELIGTADADGPFDGPFELGEALAQSNQVRQCIATTWFEYTFGRPLSEADACAFWDAYDEYEKSDFSVKALLNAYVNSQIFRQAIGE